MVAKSKPYHNEDIINQFGELLIKTWKAALEGENDQAIDLCRLFINHFYELELGDNPSCKSFQNSLEWATACTSLAADEQPQLFYYREVEWLQIQINNIYHILGYCLAQKAQRFDQAFQALHKAIYWDPLGADHYFELAAVYGQNPKTWSLALEYLKQGLDNACTVTSFAIGYADLGKLLVHMDDLEGAKAAFEKSLIFFPDNQDVLQLLFHLKETPSASVSGLDIPGLHYERKLGINLEGPLPEWDDRLISNGMPFSLADTLLVERNIPITINPKFAYGYALLGDIYSDRKSVV